MSGELNSQLIMPLGYAGRIVRAGHPVLHRPAAAITDLKSAESKALAAVMLDHMAEANGVGLAAPQIGIGLRAIVFWVPRERIAPEEMAATEDADEDSESVHILYNPKFTPLGDQMEAGIEGCLSIPDICGMVTRYYGIRYSGYDLNGNWREREAYGYHARIVQHEIDHLDGILYPSRMTELSTLVYNDELAAARESRADPS
ncbi:MAG: peptide deformylase [Candidatus Pacebacteria bacterium]|nr:peptide deformylase [Candidatus Paceibacterota bacterium]